jgi:hypothetical protein
MNLDLELEPLELTNTQCPNSGEMAIYIESENVETKRLKLARIIHKISSKIYDLASLIHKELSRLRKIVIMTKYYVDPKEVQMVGLVEFSYGFFNDITKVFLLVTKILEIMNLNTVILRNQATNYAERLGIENICKKSTKDYIQLRNVVDALTQKTELTCYPFKEVFSGFERQINNCDKLFYDNVSQVLVGYKKICNSIGFVVSNKIDCLEKFSSDINLKKILDAKVEVQGRCINMCNKLKYLSFIVSQIKIPSPCLYQQNQIKIEHCQFCQHEFCVNSFRKWKCSCTIERKGCRLCVGRLKKCPYCRSVI